MEGQKDRQTISGITIKTFFWKRNNMHAFKVKLSSDKSIKTPKPIFTNEKFIHCDDTYTEITV